MELSGRQCQWAGVSLPPDARQHRRCPSLWARAKTERSKRGKGLGGRQVQQAEERCMKNRRQTQKRRTTRRAAGGDRSASGQPSRYRVHRDTRKGAWTAWDITDRREGEEPKVLITGNGCYGGREG